MMTSDSNQREKDHTKCRWFKHGDGFGDPPLCGLYNRMARKALCDPCRNFELHPDFKEKEDTDA